MTKKLLKIKIKAKPVLKEGRDDLDKLLLEFKRLSQGLIDSTDSARKGAKVFNAFADSARVLRTGADAGRKATKKAYDQLVRLSSSIDDLLDNSETIFKQALNGTNSTLRSVDADNVIKGLEELSDTFKATKNNKNLSRPARERAKKLFIKTNKKLNRLKELRRTSTAYKASARRAKLEGQSALQQLLNNKQALEQSASNVDELAEILPPPEAVKAAGKEAADEIAPIVQKTGQQGAEEAMKKGSKWRKYLVAAGLIGTVALIYKSMGFNIADAEDKKAVSKPGRGASRGASRGGGTTIGNYDLFNRLAVQVTGQKDAKQAVKMIQEVLVNLGHSVKKGETDSGFGPGKGMVPSTKFKSVGIDGKVGPGTQGAVIRFQRANGLKPDGIVGPNTYAKLISVAKGGDPVKQAEKDPSKKVTTSDAKKAVKDIYAIIKQLNDSEFQGGHQHIINAYVEVRRNIVTQLMRRVGKGDDRGDSSSQIGSEENLKKLVANVFPSFPAGANRTEKKDFAIKIFINLPHKIKNSTINTIHITVDAQELLDMSIETLIKHSKDNLAVPDARKTEKTTAEGYNIDFSKWLKTF